MKVKQLVSELKKMPQDLDVGFSHGDNYVHEVAGWANSIDVLDKAEHDRDEMSSEGRSMFDDLPSRCVVIRG